MKKNLKEFLLEKKSELENFDEKFKDVDCKSTELTDEEKRYCANMEMVEFMKKARIANN